MPIETEIKLPARDGIREQIATLGYVEHQARHQQMDALYDLADGSLRAARKAVRLRQTSNETVLTYKGPPLSAEHKSREEIEVRVGDASAMHAILDALGYTATLRLEKHRTTFRHPLKSGLITYDETPMGDFLELEGEAAWINTTAADLGYSGADYIHTSYARLWSDFVSASGTNVPTPPRNPR
jgi:adenylate cyclase, class 2